MKHCSCGSKCGDYNLCGRCGTIIGRESLYCDPCKKRNEKDRKAQEKKAKKQQEELAKNPPPQCTCKAQVIKEVSGMQKYDKKAKKFVPINPVFGYKCHRDKRTGASVCDNCGGIPPEGFVIQTRLNS